MGQRQAPRRAPPVCRDGRSWSMGETLEAEHAGAAKAVLDAPQPAFSCTTQGSSCHPSPPWRRTSCPATRPHGMSASSCERIAHKNGNQASSIGFRCPSRPQGIEERSPETAAPITPYRTRVAKARMAFRREGPAKCRIAVLSSPPWASRITMRRINMGRLALGAT